MRQAPFVKLVVQCAAVVVVCHFLPPRCCHLFRRPLPPLPSSICRRGPLEGGSVMPWLVGPRAGCCPWLAAPGWRGRTLCRHGWLTTASAAATLHPLKSLPAFPPDPDPAPAGPPRRRLGGIVHGAVPQMACRRPRRRPRRRRRRPRRGGSARPAIGPGRGPSQPAGRTYAQRPSLCSPC